MLTIENDNSAYIIRLCEAAKEKSLLGMESECAEYFLRTLEVAKTTTDYITISSFIYKSDLIGNKHFAYTCFIKSLEASSNPVRIFKRYLRRKDLTYMVSEFMAKMPDDLFHFLLDKAVTEEEYEEISLAFKPLSIYISDPDPLIILAYNLKKAS